MTAIKRTTRQKLLKRACPSGASFLRNHRTLKQAYEDCTSPYDLLWAFQEIGLGDDPRLRDAAREIALFVFERHFKRDDPSVTIVFQWLDYGREGDRSAAYAAADSAADSASRSAAYAAYAAGCSIIRKHLPWGGF